MERPACEVDRQLTGTPFSPGLTQVESPSSGAAIPPPLPPHRTRSRDYLVLGRPLLAINRRHILPPLTLLRSTDGMDPPERAPHLRLSRPPPLLPHHRPDGSRSCYRGRYLQGTLPGFGSSSQGGQALPLHTNEAPQLLSRVGLFSACVALKQCRQLRALSIKHLTQDAANQLLLVNVLSGLPTLERLSLGDDLGPLLVDAIGPLLLAMASNAFSATLLSNPPPRSRSSLQHSPASNSISIPV